MNLILSDRKLGLHETAIPDLDLIDLSACRIANCVGCFGCWTRTPGKCVIRDDAVKIYPRIAASERLMYVTRVRYGGYDIPMKTLLERAIPIQQAFLRLHHGETHHVQRAVAPKDAVILGYGDLSEEEMDLFRRLADRNARNMNLERWRVRFARASEVDRAVREEVEAWGRS